jgi:uncharacterized protein YlxW (UPF0749 family)
LKKSSRPTSPVPKKGMPPQRPKKAPNQLNPEEIREPFVKNHYRTAPPRSNVFEKVVANAVFVVPAVNVDLKKDEDKKKEEKKEDDKKTKKQKEEEEKKAKKLKEEEEKKTKKQKEENEKKKKEDEKKQKEDEKKAKRRR